ncbi:protein PHLOEM PROTEIN 2-LIKE A10-like [Typha angustifolia]|uniref:protein PHLOEM PROTEIN 2-LIKE A10-like n=1 Tax=Typha angustifolia TaxID=59011 RepID=UPI003C2B19F9
MHLDRFLSPMDVIEFSRRRRRLLLLLAVATAGGYGAYKIYHLPSVASKRRSLSRIAGTLGAVADAAASTAETAALVSCDLSRFLHSDSDEIPHSLKQISKIVRSDEFSGSLSRILEALTRGVARGYRSGSGSGGAIQETGGSNFSDRLLDKLFSAPGSGFASTVAGSFAKNLVIGFYENGSDGGANGGSSSEQWVEVICSDKSKDLLAHCIERFVSTAVAVYLDKTMDINTYDELFSGLTNPKHETKVKDMLVGVCNGAVETLVKTSHHVLSGQNSSTAENVVKGDEQEREQDVACDSKPIGRTSSKSGGRWIDTVSSTLAVPSNRKFVLDVTGRVTFETVRSFLEFLLWKLYDGTKRGVTAVYNEVIERGLEVMRYITAKSMVIVTICFTLCLQLSTGANVIMLA